MKSSFLISFSSLVLLAVINLSCKKDRVELINNIPLPGEVTTTNIYKWALEFDSASHHHVNHGLFWVPGVTYTKFYADFLIKPTGSGYFLSAGYGGAHCLLAGVAGNPTDGYIITGNVFNNGRPQSFATEDRLRYNEWAYVAIIYDSVRITVTINGVPSSTVPYTLNRLTTNDFEGVLFIGGSNHNNYNGRLIGARIMEYDIPYPSPHNVVIRPPVESFDLSTIYNSSGLHSFNFIADYQNKQLIDIGNGLNGYKHNGFLAEDHDGNGNTVGQFSNPLLYDRVDSLLPKWVVDSFKYVSTTPAHITPPAGVRIFDSFGRPDKHYGNSISLGLGTTEVGGKTWNADHYGILNGHVFAGETSPPPALITDSHTDDSIILNKGSNTFYTGVAADYRIIFRALDNNNYEFLYMDEYGNGYLGEMVGGSSQGYLGGGSFSFGTDWTTATVVTSGNRVRIYKDNTLKTTLTMNYNNGGTGKGFYLNTPLQRIKSFAVF